MRNVDVLRMFHKKETLLPVLIGTGENGVGATPPRALFLPRHIVRSRETAGAVLFNAPYGEGVCGVNVAMATLHTRYMYGGWRDGSVIL